MIIITNNYNAFMITMEKIGKNQRVLVENCVNTRYEEARGETYWKHIFEKKIIYCVDVNVDFYAPFFCLNQR